MPCNRHCKTDWPIHTDSCMDKFISQYTCSSLNHAAFFTCDVLSTFRISHCLVKFLCRRKAFSSYSLQQLQVHDSVICCPARHRKLSQLALCLPRRVTAQASCCRMIFSVTVRKINKADRSRGRQGPPVVPVRFPCVMLKSLPRTKVLLQLPHYTNDQTSI